jgi:fatty acid desaturase
MEKGKGPKAKNDRIPKGYAFEVFVKPMLRVLCRTSVVMSVATAASDWLLMVACMYVGTSMTAYNWKLAIPLNLFLLWPLCARAQRGFENLTHEASHGNFCREFPSLNDGVANWLCANWVLISVQLFRDPHKRHHKYFGSDADPDKIRFDRLSLDVMPRQSSYELTLYLVRVLPTYVRDYWGQFSDKKRQLINSLLSHAAFATFVSITIYDKFWLLWILYFWVPFIFFLPVLRFFAEAEEHRYQNAESEFGSTFSNIGWFQRWFLHPHGDAFHLLHHMLPQVPHWKMACGNWILSTLDLDFGDGLKRKSIFDNPARQVRAVARRILITKGQRDDSQLPSRTI